MRDEDSLIEVHPEKRWDELERVLKEEWPRTMPVYSFIKTRRRWRKKEEEGTDFKIYSAGSDLKNGFITFGMKGVSSFYVLLHTFEGRDPGILVDAVLRSKKINWMDHSCFCILADQGPWIRTMMKSLGLRITKDLTTNFYQLPTEKALAVDIQCPPGVYIAPLKSKDLIKVNEVWPQSFEGAIQYLEDTIKFNPHLGVYNSEDILMSWMMTYEVGDIGVLQTDEKFKRKGYGSLVTRALAKLTAEQGDSVFCMIVVGNEASEKMFKKLDFQLVDGFSLINFEASEKI